MTSALSQVRAALERAQAALASTPLSATEAGRLAQRLTDRVGRDLLPRLGVDEPVLVVAIAGPNNVGKSTLFNALVGRVLSPARAEGGLTKQCLAAAHPSLASGPLQCFLARRYSVVPVPPGTPAPVDEAGPPGRLYLTPADEMPPGVLLMDTPDFDSIYTGNRASTEALLVTADVLVFVVSRHTYQNAALVDFLRAAVGQGRPYVLVYNEASRSEVATAHLEKLAADVGSPALARFAAEHQPEVEAGARLLQTRPLGEGLPLRDYLTEPSARAALKTRALAASLGDAAHELEGLSAAARAEAVEPTRLKDRIRHELLQAGTRAALKSVPADVLVQAFRDELDARSAVHRWIRKPFRALSTALTFVGRRVRGGFLGEAPAADAPLPAQPVDESLRDGLRSAIEALSPELAAWRGDPRTAALLQEALSARVLERLQAPLALPELADTGQDREGLYQFCRELLAHELTGGAREELFQALTTLVYSVPTGAAALVTLGTGGFGQDVVVWGGTLLSTPLLEQFVDALGANVRTRVSQRWAEAYGRTLALAVERELFSPLLTHLDERAAALARLAETLDEAKGTLHEVRRGRAEEGRVDGTAARA